MRPVVIHSPAHRFHQALLALGFFLRCMSGDARSANATTAPAESKPIPFNAIGAKATADYKGDALAVTATADGALLRCGFQKMEARATSDGLWLTSTKEKGGRFRLIASAIGRSQPSTINNSPPTRLALTGQVFIAGKLVQFARPGLIEEFSTSTDGIRQDFILPQRPAGDGALRVELSLTGAHAETTAYGAKLTLEGSNRQLAYNRLRVTDATGKELAATLEVLSADLLAVRVDDATATYPVRIDPTFSDADWVSLNPGIPGASFYVRAFALDGSGNLYIGGEFTFIGTVAANGVAKWDGSAWSALGSGMSSFSSGKALVMIGTNLYAGGNFTTAGGVANTNRIAKWNGQGLRMKRGEELDSEV